MGTQGIVSVTKNGQTVAKAVCGDNGQNAGKLAALIRDLPGPPTAPAVYQLAQVAGFGCPDCLVVVDRYTTEYHGDAELDGSYRATFDDPLFNPRWDSGTADVVEVVAFDPVRHIRDRVLMAVLFWHWSQDGHDRPESTRRYAEMLESKLRTAFPGTEIEVVVELDTEPVRGMKFSTIDGSTEHPAVETIRHIGLGLYIGQEWLVQTGPTP